MAPLGAGGMGEVYRARDARLGRDVAIKVLPAAFSSDAERLHRFEQEARAAAALNHPNILSIHDIGQHEQSPFIVSEVLEGETLRERLAAGPLPVRKAIDCAIQIARGLAAAHEKGIAHRDLKPENLFVTTDGRVKILDFGLAKLTQADPVLAAASVLPTSPPQTLPGIVLGTIGYMAPEQVRGLPADHRSDLFAFGAILYEMLSARRAFTGETAADAMTAILKEDPPDLPAVERAIPPALARIVDRCLEKSPQARFQSASDLAFALEALSTSQSSTTTQPVTRAGFRLPAGRELVAWALVLVLVSVMTGVAMRGRLARPSTVDAPVVRAIVPAPEGSTIGGAQPPDRLALSPDGRRLAFVAVGPDRRRQLWVQSLDAATAQPLEGTQHALSPFWSPDSRLIGFFAAGRLKKIDPSGRPAVTVCAIPGMPDGDIRSVVVGGTWNRDGVIVFGVQGQGITDLYQAAASGSQPVPLSARDGNLPYFLPDGKHVLYRLNEGSDSAISVATLDGGESRVVLQGGVSQPMYAAGHLLYVRDLTLWAQPFDATRLILAGDPVPLTTHVMTGSGGNSSFTVSQSGMVAYQSGEKSQSRSRLAWFDRTGKQVGLVDDEAAYGIVALSWSGTRAVVSVYDNDKFTADLWLVDLARPSRTRFFASPDAVDKGWAIWSPGDDRVVFRAGLSDRRGQTQIYEKASNGLSEAKAFGHQGIIPFGWSRDGRFMAVTVRRELSVLTLVGNAEAVPVPQVSGASHGQFSPDGRWIAYRSNESGVSDVYITPFPGEPGTKMKVSGESGGNWPRWGRDGKELFFVSSDSKMMSVDIRGEGAGLQVGAPKMLFDARVNESLSINGWPYDVAPDGRFLTNGGTEGVAPITLLVNWPSAVGKK